LKSIKLHGWPFAVQPEGAPLVTATKSDLIQAVAEANGFPLNRSVEIIEILLELIKAKLAAGEDVLISGFGKFCIKKKRERRGWNPPTVKEIRVLCGSI
jgi:integration host factor subunit alpha